MLRDFRITDFKKTTGAVIGHQAVAADPSDTEQMNMRTLWKTDTARARRTALAIYAGGGGVHDGADGCPA